MSVRADEGGEARSWAPGAVADAPAQRLVGLLVGQAVADAIGLPAEGLGPARIAKRFPGALRHRLVAGRGMISDDTEHALLTAQALLAAGGDEAAFTRALRRQLVGWFLGLPAGIGLATLRACVRMALGLREPGVRSAGNGPGMRAPVVGACYRADAARRVAFVRASTRLTHTDPRAETAAQAVAWLAAAAVRDGVLPAWGTALAELGGFAGPEDAEWPGLLAEVGAGLAAGEDVPAFALRLGLARGVTGYAYHTAPVVVFAAFRHGADYAGAIAGIVAAGGDTDSVAAQAGAICGALAREAGIPAAWVAGVVDWPRGLPLARSLAARLAAGGGRPVGYAWWALPLRNALFIAIVLAHGFRRLAPPY